MDVLVSVVRDAIGQIEDVQAWILPVAVVAVVVMVLHLYLNSPMSIPSVTIHEPKGKDG